MKCRTASIQDCTFSLNCNGKLLNLSSPKIMGILNLTPDSFSDGGKYFDEKSALNQVEKMLKEGATIIDIGAQSTRPNAEYLTSETEISRLAHLISKIKTTFPEAFLSLDTFYSEVVRFGFDEGIDIVNDISGGNFDAKMFETVGKTGLPYILTHSNKTYQAMHLKLIEDDILLQLNQYFSKKIQDLQSFGVKDLMLDPGFGFGKKVAQQYQLLDETEFIGFGNYPLLIGVSRKSFIYKPLGKKPEDIDEETQKLHLKVLERGAKILRVHDVKEARKTIDDFLGSRN